MTDRIVLVQNVVRILSVCVGDSPLGEEATHRHPSLREDKQHCQTVQTELQVCCVYVDNRVM